VVHGKPFANEAGGETRRGAGGLSLVMLNGRGVARQVESRFVGSEEVRTGFVG
jgi:hypothetical protein